MAQDEVDVKGIRQGLLVSLGEGPWEEQLAQLERRLQAGASFFQGGRAVLQVGARELDDRQIQTVRDLLGRYEVDLWALLSTCDATVLAAAHSGLAPDLRLWDQLRDGGQEAETILQGGLVVTQTIRSGQRIEHTEDIVIIGDVHAGAEVVAGRNVVVWGKLRGVVHAGAMGDEGAVVCALDLAPTQLRIAGHIARSPEEKRRRPTPEMARVRSGRIEAVPWHRR